MVEKTIARQDRWDQASDHLARCACKLRHIDFSSRHLQAARSYEPCDTKHSKPDSRSTTKLESNEFGNGKLGYA